MYKLQMQIVIDCLYCNFFPLFKERAFIKGNKRVVTRFKWSFKNHYSIPLVITDKAHFQNLFWLIVRVKQSVSQYTCT